LKQYGLEPLVTEDLPQVSKLAGHVTQK